jgi:EAL domain-containing protein (putative c-di-GMP-specific phosphodiesterase class I)
MIIKNAYEAGSVIIEQGDEGDCAYIVDQGLVEIFVMQDGEKIVLALLSDGDIFGEMALISGAARSASARAVIPTTLTVINMAVFQDLLAQSDPVISLLLRVLLERFQDAQSKLLSMPLGYVSQIKAASERVLLENDERRETLQRFKFINDLQAAVEGKQLQLLYQPIIDLASGLLAGFEALIRWKHPEQGTISPVDFIRIAEETKEIVPIGYWIFETACNDLKRLRDSLGVDQQSPSPWMSINVSTVQFHDPSLLDNFVRLLDKSGVPPYAIKIELTESALVSDPQQTMLFLHEVRRIGMKVAIDDFGTGYSSLSYLHLFPIDTLKIDNTFVSSMSQDARSREIVHAIVVLSKNLNLDIIAEGIENLDLETLISQLGCRYAQGYLYSKPIPFEQALGLLTKSFKS